MNYDHNKKFGLLKFHSGYGNFYFNSPNGYNRKIINAQTEQHLCFGFDTSRENDTFRAQPLTFIILKIRYVHTHDQSLLHHSAKFQTPPKAVDLV